MEKINLSIFDDEIDAIMDEIPEELWYNKSQENDDNLSQNSHFPLQILSTW